MTIARAVFTAFILALIKGGNQYQDDDATYGAGEGAFPADRFEGE